MTTDHIADATLHAGLAAVAVWQVVVMLGAVEALAATLQPSGEEPPRTRGGFHLAASAK